MKKKIVLIALGTIMLAALFFLLKGKAETAEIIFFDVGQGDSIYIEAKGNFQALIDGGPDATVLDKLGRQMPFYDRQIELIVLTHPDSDHLFGLLEVLRNYEVKNILWTGVVKDTAEWKEWVRLIEEEQANVMIAQAGQKFVLQKDPSVILEIIYPLESLEGVKTEDINGTSIVAVLSFESASILLTGDISTKEEKELIEKYNLNADILKIGHHGSKTSSGPEFLEAVQPKTAIISVGENKWGHPSESVLQRLENFGIKVLITKELGDIEFNF